MQTGNPSIRDVLTPAVYLLGERGVPNPRLDAELLLAEVLDLPQHAVLTDLNRKISPDEMEAFNRLVLRRAQREPLQYILGRQEFWSLEFPVDRRVLIPRPETELVVEAALQAGLGAGSEPLFIDIGCGCGNIAVVLAREIPGARVLAVDVSQDAAAAAGETVRRYGLSDRVMVICADMFEALKGDVLADIIVSNPPYIDSSEIASLQEEVARFEPRVALEGGAGGLEAIRKLVAKAAGHLRPKGKIVFEAGAGQEEEIRRIVDSTMGWRSYRFIEDYAGIPRVHIAERE